MATWCLLPVALSLFVACIGGMLALYFCLVRYLASRSLPQPAVYDRKGLTAAELEAIAGDVLVVDAAAAAAAECAVCLDDIEAAQVARVLPGCRHVFHRECADRWLMARPQCPLCRAQLLPPPPPPPPRALEASVC